MDIGTPLLTKTDANTREGKMDASAGSGATSFRTERDCGATCGFTSLGEVGEQDDTDRKLARRKLIMAIGLCFAFMVVEVIGGILANSLAILTDAAHLLSDIAGFAISLFALWMSSWEATPKHTFGYHRMEILGALVSMQIIWMITGVLVYEAVHRLLNDSDPVDGRLMFITAALGVAVNLAMTFLLGHDHAHGHGHGHGHDHSGDHGHDHGHDQDHDQVHDRAHDHHHDNNHDHDHEHEHALSNPNLLEAGEGRREHLLATPDAHEHREVEARKSVNINIQGAYLHVLGDLIQSIGVLIGGAVIWWNPNLKVVDLICTLGFSVLVLVTTLRMLRDVLEVLMESTPRAINATEVEEGLRSLESVVDVHELHIWAITLGKVVLAVHVRIPAEADPDEVLHRVLDFLEHRYGISHATVQVERGNECQ